MKLNNVSIFILLFSFNVTAGVKSPYTEALCELKRSAPSKAASLLKGVEKTSNDFVTSLVELQKLHYKNQDWNAFFAYAVFYRSFFVASPKSELFSGRLLVLEALALAKHCRWAESLAILNGGLELAKQFQSPELSELDHAKLFLAPLKSYAGIQAPAQTKSNPSGLFSTIHYWPVTPKAVQMVPHPKFLRMRVESRCSL